MNKPTLGPWRCKPICESGWVDIVSDDPTRKAYEVASTRHEHAEANAILIAEAGTIYHETGRTPRQLADERAELVAALDNLQSILCDPEGNSSFEGSRGDHEIAREAFSFITKTKGSPS